ncbi:MAG: glycosyl hydrolase 2 galactose-binding domain-containing protein [Acutalibacteraceae bacterium]
MKKTLCGEWELHDSKNKYRLNAVVPGCNYLDLMREQVISDPFYGINEKDVYWVAETDWIYSKKIDISQQELSFEAITLECKRLDTICDIYLNGSLVASGKNCHVGYSFPVKSYLKAGENELKIYFHSPVNYVRQKYKQERTPANNNGQNGISHIRKPQCHFGWDWGPVLPPSGIDSDIYLELKNCGKITDLKIRQKKNKDASFTVSAETEAELKNGETIEIELISPNGDLIARERAGKGEFIIKNPQLWWTHELSPKPEQPLYTVQANLMADKEIVHTVSKKIGLREIRLNRKNDQYGQNFQFILNDVPIFIKGANYIPADSFITRFTDDKLEYLIDSVLYSNMNMLRVWGGGYYESDEFYDICDRKGILVWQDFCFACQPYPFFDTEFLNNVKNEIEYNVKRLRHHASLALWCGNNEIESMSLAWQNRPKYVKWTEKFFYDILPGEVRKYDEDTPFIPGTPCGIGHMKGFDRDNVGDTHLWAVWHGLQPMKYYRKRMTRFCSEFGFESLPDIKTIRQFAKPDEYDLHSDVFKSHQKCASGNDKMIYYIATRFRLPKNFEDWIYLSQVTQLECISDATEHWRRNKGRCNGSVYWQLNDCWGVCSWSGMDYYGNYKALQYKARDFNAPLSVSIEDTDKSINFYVLNDKIEDQSVTFKYEIFDFTKGVVETHEKSVTVKSLENVKAAELTLSSLKAKYNLSEIGIRAVLSVQEKDINEKTFIFKAEKDIVLPKADIRLEKSLENDQIVLKVTSDRYARLVRLHSELSTLPFSVNYFDLIPGQAKTVLLPVDKHFDIDRQLDSISVKCANDIEPKASRLYDIKERIRVFLQPVNFAQWVYNRKIPNDLKIEN